LEEEMKRYDYIIVGAGMTGDAAVRGIRELDPNGSILLVGGETDPPYARPPLSKKLWQGKPLESVWRGTEAFGVELILGRRVVGLDCTGQSVRDDRGEEYGYGRLLLATGGVPRRLPFGGEEIIYFRTLDDYRRLRALADAGGRFAIIGGGFIGSEVAAALAMNGCGVTMLFPEATIGRRVFPVDLAAFVTDYYRQKGVEVMAGESVAGVERTAEEMAVTTESGQRTRASAVVAGIGIEPELELPRQAGLPTDGGVEVDEFLRAGDPHIFAAGDLASFFSPQLGRRMRVEHEDNAVTMGRQAGRNMAGAGEPYSHLPYFYSDLFDLGYEAVGELDSRLETVADWKEPYREGVVYYLREGRVRGVLLWNVWDQVEAARSLIAAGEKVTPEALHGRLPVK
jgi:NADPH-dependent 2,4-dienoyl-CoA reductase/sulfur reductase-like enzyme